MRTHPSDVDHFDFELHHSDQSVIIAFDVENESLIPDAIYAIEILLHISETVPIRLLRSLVPHFQSRFRIVVRTIK